MSTVLDRLAKLEDAFQLLCGKQQTNGKHLNMLHLENETMSVVVHEAYVVKLRELEDKCTLILNKLNEVIDYLHHN